MRTRVKICGITNPEDGLAAIHEGADSLGLVFYPPSSRHISIDRAENLVSQLPPFVSITGLFVNAEKAFIDEVVQRVKIDLIQFHGDEPEDFCRQMSRPYIKAIRMKPGTDLSRCEQDYGSARALLLDTYKKGTPGGTGEVFNWDQIPHNRNKAIILAGGLKADNVAQAINTVHPYAVDVSGGVEQQPGRKDPEKVRQFMVSVSA